MDSPRPEEEDEDDTDWMSREEQEERTGIPVHQKGASFCRPVTRSDASRRVTVHLDMDCFYAQVEMIRNPELKDKPLGVQQKYLLVTCNYVARKCGVNKCMSLKEAKEKCPQLVLVSGEDLTHYRETSYRVTELLEEFSPKVERLGFDENFVDITELVDKKTQEPQNDGSLEVSGHVYNNQMVNGSDWTHRRLVAGSHIAADIRAAVHSRLGLTSCAGIACNKVLSKLVAGTFKPNQQTVLFPESSSHLINSLNHVQRIPGIGHKTAQRLEGLGLSSICALQSCPVTVLEKEFGSPTAYRLQQLSRGEDDSPVTPSGPPQSLSEEDSFKKCSTLTDVKLKIEELLRSLLNRVYVDGRSPQTLRLTLRQSSPTNRYFNRESRQCPIPKNVIQNPSSESSFSVLMELLMKLFEKMIDAKTPFHLTLLNVCFSNLKSAQTSNSSRNSIGFYLTQKKAPSMEASQISKDPGATAEDLKDTEPCSNLCSLESDHPASLSLPDHIDMDVFSQLPDDIKKEILSSPRTGTVQKSSKATQPSPCSKGIQSFFMKANARHLQSSFTAGSSSGSEMSTPGLHNKMDSSGASLSIGRSSFTGTQSAISGDKTACAGSSSCISDSNQISRCHDTDMDCAESSDSSRVSFFPRSVDMNVFSQLPEELQKELMADWKHKELAPKIPAMKSQEKAKNTKGQRPSSSAKKDLNNLLKYFKPG
ncbi:PREDICTED: DNA polymerase iota [Nanorana parkeri]|uniref:DNA polymerase iota n=1 Tax=Nanorana parkeri TaxID=125878 RepID=UPI000854086A|nr:PREDICTED: DNA polymerase iota [Nanorana parkeri]